LYFCVNNSSYIIQKLSKILKYPEICDNIYLNKIKQIKETDDEKMYRKIFIRMCFLSMLTLVLTAAMAVSCGYSLYTSRLEEELKNEADTICQFLDMSENPVSALQNITISPGRRIMLTDENGKVLFDSGTDTDKDPKADSRQTEISAAGRPEGSSRYFSLSSAKTFYYYEKKLANSMLFSSVTSSKTVMSFLLTVLAAVIFIAVLICIFSVMTARQLTENIIKPIEDFYTVDDKSIENVYEEIKPFIARIARQNEEIQRQMEKIRSQKTRLEIITDNINEGLIILDRDKNILSLNDYSVKLFKAGEYTYKHRYFDTLTDIESLRAAVTKALNGKKNDITVKIGKSLYQAFCSPTYEQDEISGVIVLLIDITDKAETEMIRREFTANVSHELKTPLTSIHGFAQIIAGGIARPEDITGFAKRIEKESSRLIVLIDDIIKLSRLDEGAVTYEKQKFTLAGIVHEIFDMLSDRASEKNIQISVSGDTEIYANPSQITEMLYNLCDNAIKYNKQNGSIEILISDKTITVRDTGIGIPKDALGRIYERFFRVDKSHSKKVNGTGLGLSIVKHIAQSNNAEIYVESELGKGTCFTVTFPD